MEPEVYTNDDSSITNHERKTKGEQDLKIVQRPIEAGVIFSSFKQQCFSVSVHLVSVDARPLAEAVDAYFDLVPDEHEALVDLLVL